MIFYTLLSGLSPFLDETDEQTSSNIVNVDFNFPESLFPRAFQPAKDLIQAIFVREPRFARAFSSMPAFSHSHVCSHRPSASECLMNEWFHSAGQYQISTTNLNNFIERRKSQVGADNARARVLETNAAVVLGQESSLTRVRSCKNRSAPLGNSCFNQSDNSPFARLCVCVGRSIYSSLSFALFLHDC